MAFDYTCAPLAQTGAGSRRTFFRRPGLVAALALL
jgi:hypothetical protein